jgi:hypothetical protein
MKATRCLSALLAFGGLILAGCSDELQSPVSPNNQSLQGAASLQKEIIRPFTSTEGPNLLDPGLVVPEPRVADGKTIFMGIQENTVFNAVFPDGGPDLLSGYGVLEMNAIIDNSDGSIFNWGTLTVTPTNPAAEGGVWDITFHGHGWIDPLTGMTTVPLIWVGHGSDGAVNGMQLRGDDTIYMPDLTNLLDWIGKDGENNFIKEHG